MVGKRVQFDDETFSRTASLIIAFGLGVIVGYLIRPKSEFDLLMEMAERMDTDIGELAEREDQQDITFLSEDDQDLRSVGLKAALKESVGARRKSRPTKKNRAG